MATEASRKAYLRAKPRKARRNALLNALAEWRSSADYREAIKSPDKYIAGKLRIAFEAGFCAGVACEAKKDGE